MALERGSTVYYGIGSNRNEPICQVYGEAVEIVGISHGHVRHRGIHRECHDIHRFKSVSAYCLSSGTWTRETHRHYMARRTDGHIQ